MTINKQINRSSSRRKRKQICMHVNYIIHQHTNSNFSNWVTTEKWHPTCTNLTKKFCWFQICNDKAIQKSTCRIFQIILFCLFLCVLSKLFMEKTANPCLSEKVIFSFFVFFVVITCKFLLQYKKCNQKIHFDFMKYVIYLLNFRLYYQTIIDDCKITCPNLYIHM